jgi:hypothetical protein
MKALSVSGVSNLWAAATMMALAIIAVALRVVVRFKAGLPFTWSDYLIWLSLTMTIANTASIEHCGLQSNPTKELLSLTHAP